MLGPQQLPIRLKGIESQDVADTDALASVAYTRGHAGFQSFAPASLDAAATSR